MPALTMAPRPAWRHLLVLNLTVAVGVTLLLSSVQAEAGPRLVLGLFGVCLAFANGLGLPAAYVMRHLAPRIERLRFPFDWLGVAGAILALTVAGTSVAGLIFHTTAGGAVFATFWADLRFSAVVSLSVGLTVFAFERGKAELLDARAEIERRDGAEAAPRAEVPGRSHPTRITSRRGDRLKVVPVAEVSHFVARDKLTYAVAQGRAFCVDPSLSELEKRLDPRRFVRVHRSAIVNLDWVEEVAPGIGGGLLVRLKDEAGTPITVARDRARTLKDALGG